MLAELHRVLRPAGRLVVAEVVDPDFVLPARLRWLAEATGFVVETRYAPFFAYHARLVRT